MLQNQQHGNLDNQHLSICEPVRVEEDNHLSTAESPETALNASDILMILMT